MRLIIKIFNYNYNASIFIFYKIKINLLNSIMNSFYYVLYSMFIFLVPGS